MKIGRLEWTWQMTLMIVVLPVLMGLIMFDVVHKYTVHPSVSPPAATHSLCSRVVMLTQCTKIEKVYRHSAVPQVISNTCVQIDDNIFCWQVAIERLTEEQCKQYKDTTWGLQN